MNSDCCHGNLLARFRSAGGMAGHFLPETCCLLLPPSLLVGGRGPLGTPLPLNLAPPLQPSPHASLQPPPSFPQFPAPYFELFRELFTKDKDGKSLLMQIVYSKVTNQPLILNKSSKSVIELLNFTGVIGIRSMSNDYEKFLRWQWTTL